MNTLHTEWAFNAFNNLEYQLETTKPEIILDTAWPAVCRFQTNLQDPNNPNRLYFPIRLCYPKNYSLISKHSNIGVSNID